MDLQLYYRDSFRKETIELLAKRYGFEFIYLPTLTVNFIYMDLEEHIKVTFDNLLIVETYLSAKREERLIDQAYIRGYKDAMLIKTAYEIILKLFICLVIKVNVIIISYPSS